MLKDQYIAPGTRLGMVGKERGGVGRDLPDAANGPTPKAEAARRILVVEDNLDSVHSLCRLLRSAGHEVEYAINGYAALAIAKAFHPDIVLLDIGLPGISGYDVCSRLRVEPGFEQTRFIAVTAYGQDAARIRSLAVGCELHIVKPYDPNYLLSVISSSPARRGS
jgi:CheY-like chemotaxis protein